MVLHGYGFCCLISMLRRRVYYVAIRKMPDKEIRQKLMLPSEAHNLMVVVFRSHVSHVHYFPSRDSKVEKLAQ